MSESTLVLSTDDKSAAALVVTIKAAVNGAGKYAAYVADHAVTRDNVKDHARALAVLAYPNDKPVQTVKNDEGKSVRTRFGNAVQAAGNGLRSVLDPAPVEDKDENYLTVVGVSTLTAMSREDMIAAIDAEIARRSQV